MKTEPRALPDSINSLLSAELSLLDEVEAIAGRPVDLIQAVHGDEWKTQIDHDAGLVAVSRNFGGRE